MFYCPFHSLLPPPTTEECKTAVGQYRGVSFFPHALSNPYSDGLQNAVFRIEGNPAYEQTCLVVTANDSASALHDAWPDVLADFLAFAQKEALSLDRMTEFSFFKVGPGRYWPDRMFSTRDIGQWGPWERTKAHPEIREGEILLYNTRTSDTRSVSLKTLRIGEIAYSRSGERIPPEKGLVPVFAQLGEILTLKWAERKN